MQAARGAHSLGERRAVVLLFSTAAVWITVDQITKAMAVASLRPGEPVRALGHIVYWTLQRNSGAAFSIFTSVPWLFTILAFLISIAIVVYARHVSSRMYALALGLVLGGAIGNLIDRLARAPGPFRGHVVDFIDLRVWPVFNVADSGVVIGAILLVLASFLEERSKRA
ncbi:MAG: signal peptidase II [Actinomycetota bacterium]